MCESTCVCGCVWHLCACAVEARGRLWLLFLRCHSPPYHASILFIYIIFKLFAMLWETETQRAYVEVRAALGVSAFLPLCVGSGYWARVVRILQQRPLPAWTLLSAPPPTFFWDKEVKIVEVTLECQPGVLAEEAMGWKQNPLRMAEMGLPWLGCRG